MSLTRHLGLDLGGTNIKAVVLENRDTDAPPILLHSRVVPTKADRGPDQVSDSLITVGNAIRTDIGDFTTVGLAVPGLFSATTGEIEMFPNLPGRWNGFNLRDAVSQGLGQDAVMINDARAFTLAEGSIGAGRGAKVMLGITLGTGIGGGVMIDGRLHTGAFGTAGEFGHQTVQPDGPVCGCGNRGCLEAAARGEVIAAEAGFGDVEELYAAAAAGEDLAVRAVERASFLMAIAISNAVSLLGVDVVVVGGGIASVGDLVLNPLRRAVASRITLVPTDEIRIVTAELGLTAGAIGASLVASDQPWTRPL